MKILIYLVLIGNIVLGQKELYVGVKNGIVRGKIMYSYSGRDILGFMGIPYAKPPIGDLRFKPPEASDNWTGVKDGTQVHKICTQRNPFVDSEVIEGDEDCLFINVYKPRNINETLLPVMVFIHGGGWVCGSGNADYYSPTILLDKDIVLVTFNYRLGALGFFTTGDEVVPGNNGLKDQTLALKWVQENIKKFGGNANNVMLFGQSAGAASTHFHMLSPLSKGLFHKAISQSVTALIPSALALKGLGIKNSLKLAELVGCSFSDNQKMVDCLRNVDQYTIIEQDKRFLEWGSDPQIPFKPVIETKHPGAFISEHPLEIIRSGKVHNVPWIVGLTSDEGCLRVPELFKEPHYLKELDKNFNRLLPMMLQFENTAGDNPKKIAKKVRQFYFGDKQITNTSRRALIDLFTDGGFLYSVDKAVYMHKKYLDQEIYFYVFKYRGYFSFSDDYGGKVDFGVCHGDDILYLFPKKNPIPGVYMNAWDREVTNLLTTLWTNFAINSKPTSNVADWTPVTSLNNMEYLDIKNSWDVKMEKGPYLERSQFWRSLPIDSAFSRILENDL